MTARRLGVAVGAALLAVAAIVPGANAQTQSVTAESFKGEATGQAFDISVLGRRFTGGLSAAGSSADAVKNTVTGTAMGAGLLLAPESVVKTVLGQPGAQGCTQHPLEALSSLIPVDLGVALACGEVGSEGTTPDAHRIWGDGSVASVSLGVGDLFDQIFGTDLGAGSLDSVLDEALGTVFDSIESNDPGVVDGIDTLVGALDPIGQELGVPVVLPQLDPEETVRQLLDRIRSGDLVRISLGGSHSEAVGTASDYLAKAVSEGGKIELLPDLAGTGKALLSITISQATAQVGYARGSATPKATADDMLVKIESLLLPDLTALNGALAGTPLADALNQLGFQASDGSITLAPGESVKLFCPGEPTLGVPTPEQLAPLCSEISVGRSTVTATSAQSNSVEIHLLQGVDPVLNNADLNSAIDPLVAQVQGIIDTVDAGLAENGLPPTGLKVGLGQTTTDKGINVVIAGASATSDGAKVLGLIESTRDFEGPLPRTGMESAPYLVTGLLGLSAGLRMLARRRSA